MRRNWKAGASRLFMLALIAVLMAGLVYTGPIDVALIGAIDLATYIDALVGVYVIAQVGRLSSMLGLARVGIATRLGRRRTRSTIHRARKIAPANDDDRRHARAA